MVLLSQNISTLEEGIYSQNELCEIRPLFKSMQTYVDGGQAVGVRGVKLSKTKSNEIETYTKIFLLGAVQVIAPNGKNITPRSQKSKALIALLAASKRGERTRTWICDKLWSDKGAKKSNDSLRQSVREIKRAFGRFSNDILDIGRTSIRIRPSNVIVDVKSIDEHSLKSNYASQIELQSEFLEGLDVRDEEFEDWLVLERNKWENIIHDLLSGIEDDKRETHVEVFEEEQSGSLSKAEKLPSFGIGLLPSVTAGISPELAPLADSIVESIARSLQELHPLDIYDYRDWVDQKFGIPANSGPDVLLRVRVQTSGSRVDVSFLAFKAEEQKLVWQHSIVADQTDFMKIDNTTLSGFISQNVDRMSNLLFSNAVNNRESSGWKYGFNALNTIFSLKDDAMSSTEQLLASASKHDDVAAYQGMLAYLSTFKIGEAYGSFNSEARETTQSILARQQTEHPFNSISLACLGHVCSYVLKDYSVAEEFLTNAITINPHQAFAWDHYALLKIYTGDYEAAKIAAVKAVTLGSFSPLRYSYETTLAMALIYTGEFRLAIHYAKRALSRQPNFLAANRYLTVALGCSGQIEDAETAGARLVELDPEFSDKKIQMLRFSINNKASKAKIIEGLQKAGFS